MNFQSIQSKTLMARDDGHRLFEDIAANGARERHLHAAGVVSDARHQQAGPHLVKEIHRLPEDLVEEINADIGDDLLLTQFM